MTEREGRGERIIEKEREEFEEEEEEKEDEVTKEKVRWRTMQYGRGWGREMRKRGSRKRGRTEKRRMMKLS